MDKTIAIDRVDQCYDYLNFMITKIEDNSSYSLHRLTEEFGNKSLSFVNTILIREKMLINKGTKMAPKWRWNAAPEISKYMARQVMRKVSELHKEYGKNSKLRQAEKVLDVTNGDSVPAATPIAANVDVTTEVVAEKAKPIQAAPVVEEEIKETMPEDMTDVETIARLKKDLKMTQMREGKWKSENAKLKAKVTIAESAPKTAAIPEIVKTVSASTKPVQVSQPVLPTNVVEAKTYRPFIVFGITLFSIELQLRGVNRFLRS